MLRGPGRRRVCEACKRPRSGIRGSVRKSAAKVFVVIPTSRAPLCLAAPALRCVGPRRQARTSVSGRRRRQAARNVSCEFSSPCERAWAAMRHAPATAKQSASLPHPTFPAAVAPPACRSQCARCRHAGHARVPARPRHLLLLHLCWPCVRRLWVLLPDATQTQTQTWQMPDATQAQSLNPKHSMIQPCS